jgi:hypothetical protein
VISVVAYELLNGEDQAEVTELLTHMPDFEKYFAAPDGIRNQGSIDRWRMGVAGNWPDLIRGTDLDRPSWHYELGASRVLGNVRPDRPPGPLPRAATLETQKLYLSQATELCRRILADRDQPEPDRAVALVGCCTCTPTVINRVMRVRFTHRFLKVAIAEPIELNYVTVETCTALGTNCWATRRHRMRFADVSRTWVM